MVAQKYPSGRVVKNVLDNDGDLAIVQSKKNANAGYFSYADSFTYTAAGAVSSMQLGNGKWESTQFNSRLQPTQIALGTVQNGTDKLKLNFNYGTTANNGNVLSQTITVPTTGAANGFNAAQNYSYDSLNRLKSATETIGVTQSWKQTFTFDRYGNRNFDTANTTTIPTGCATAVCNPQVDPATNKLIGYQFDNSGNTKIDATNRQFIYDGENKQVEVKDQYGASIGKYFFDGDGKRVKKISATETTIFVYDAGGKMVAEYSTLLNPTPQVSYLTTDHLGSPRINTDENGKVIARHDFLPFGEEIARANYGADVVRQKFTGYERDNESNLDYAKARMHNYNLGRFTSPDPFNIVFEKQLEKDPDKGNRQFRNYISKPEQWNKYVYAINNPLKFVDPDGREIRLDSSLTEKERNEILYHLQKLTRDKLNWQTDSKGNVNIVITKTNGGGNDSGTRLIRRLDGYKSVVTITTSSGGNSQTSHNGTNESNGVGSDSTVRFNPNATPKIGTLDENTGISRSQDRPVWIGLAHELIHADHAARGTTLTGTGTYSYRDTNGIKQTATENRYELATVGIGGQNNRMDITENDIRGDQGLRVRSEY
jgi:RHS repeat-associated protein